MDTYKLPNRVATITACMLLLIGSLKPALADTVTLQQPTATFSQTSFADYSVGKAINGTDGDNLGWAIAVGTSTVISSQTAAFETAADVGFLGGSIVTFTLIQTHTGPTQHTLGRFRLSLTTDNRSLFADGLASGGDVAANWVVFNPTTFTTANGATLSKLADNSLLASGLNPDFEVYTISGPTSLTGITGLRLEALEDSSLPYGGPGRWPGNGNFVLAELQMDIVAVPEPSGGAIIALGGLVLAALRRTEHN